MIAGEITVINAIEQDVTRVNLIKAHQQVHHRGLASSGGSHDGDRRARGNFQTEILDQWLVGLVAKTHVFEAHAGATIIGGTKRVGDHNLGSFLVGVEELKDSFGGGDARLEHVHLTRDLSNGHRELARVLNKRRHGPQRQQSRGHAISAQDGNSDVVDVGNELHGRLDDPREELRLETRTVQRLIVTLELLNGCRPSSKDLHEFVSRVRLFDQAVQGPGAAPLVGEVSLGALGDPHRHHERQGNGDDTHQRQ